MVQLTSTLAVGLFGLSTLVAAHPGHSVKAEAAERAAFVKSSALHTRNLSQCASKLKARGVENKNVLRREQTVQRLRQRRGIQSSMNYSSGNPAEK